MGTPHSSILCKVVHSGRTLQAGRWKSLERFRQEARSINSMPGLSKEPGQLVVHQALDLDEVPRKALRFRHELCDGALSQEHISIQCHGPFCATLKPDLVSPAKSCFKWSLVDDLHGIPTDLHPQQLPADLQCTASPAARMMTTRLVAVTCAIKVSSKDVGAGRMGLVQSASHALLRYGGVPSSPRRLTSYRLLPLGLTALAGHRSHGHLCEGILPPENEISCRRPDPTMARVSFADQPRVLTLRCSPRRIESATIV